MLCPYSQMLELPEKHAGGGGFCPFSFVFFDEEKKFYKMTMGYSLLIKHPSLFKSKFFLMWQKYENTYFNFQGHVKKLFTVVTYEFLQ